MSMNFLSSLLITVKNWNRLSSFHLLDWELFQTLINERKNVFNEDTSNFKYIFESKLNEKLVSSFNDDSLLVYLKIGSIIRQNLDNGRQEYRFSNISTIFSYSTLSFGKYLRAWSYPRITNNNTKLLHYTGLPQKKERLGFDSGEVDMSGIGFFGKYKNMVRERKTELGCGQFE